MPFGRIIAFYKNGLRVKRIIEIKKINRTEYYTTKGDNNYYLDPGEIQKSNIEGKVIGRIRYLGFFLKIIQSKWFTLFVTIVLILIVLFYENMKRKEERRQKLRKIHKNTQK